MRGFLWPTELLMFSDFLVATPHAHSALQLSIGLDQAPRVQLDGVWHHARGVLVDTDVAHAAGFADSAHLTRTANRMNGYSPTKMRYQLWLSNCR